MSIIEDLRASLPEMMFERALESLKRAVPMPPSSGLQEALMALLAVSIFCFGGGEERVLSLELFKHFVRVQPRKLEGRRCTDTRRELSLTKRRQAGALRDRFEAVVESVTCLGAVRVDRRRDGDSP